MLALASLKSFFFFLPIAWYISHRILKYEISNFHLHFIISTLLRIVTLFYFEKYGTVDDDTWAYNYWGTQIAQKIEMGDWNFSSITSSTWAYFCGLLYWIFGCTPRTILGFNLFLNLLNTPLFLKIFKSLYIERPPKKHVLCAIYTLMYLPTFWAMCTDHLKTPVAITLSGLMYVSLYKINFKKIVIFITSTLLLAIVRAPQAFINLVTFSPLIFSEISRKMGVEKRIKIIFFSIIFFVGLILTPQFKHHFIDHVIERTINLQENPLTKHARTGLAYKFIDAENPWSIRNIIVTPIRSLFSPGPFRIFKMKYGHQSYAEIVYVAYESIFYGLFIFLGLPLFVSSMFASGVPRLRFVSIYLIYWITFLVSAYTELTEAPVPLRYRITTLPLYFLVILFAILNRNKIPPKLVTYLSCSWAIAVGIFGVIYLIVL